MGFRQWIFWLGNGGISMIATPSGWKGIGNYPFVLGQWYHVAIRRIGTTLTAFADGVSIELTGEVILDGVEQSLNGVYAGPQILDASSAPFQTVIMVGETLSLSMNF